MSQVLNPKVHQQPPRRHRADLKSQTFVTYINIFSTLRIGIVNICILIIRGGKSVPILAFGTNNLCPHHAT